jgi:uncharacterized protein DUF6894
MPLYYFHLSFGDGLLEDNEGVELPGRAAARAETLAVIRDLADRAVGRRWAGWFIEVADEQGSFLRLPVGYPALQVLPENGGLPAPAVPTSSCLLRLEPAPEGMVSNQVADAHRQRLVLRKRTSELLERNCKIRDELFSQMTLSEQIRLRTRQLLASARLVGWFGDEVPVGPAGERQPRPVRPHLVLLPGGGKS